MASIVYNACYGGFCLSRAAVLRGREISGNPKWGGVCIKGDAHDGPGGQICPSDYGFIEDVPRHDPVLVQVVKELGKTASGDCSSLKIHELPSGTLYRIDEYDGNERVMTDAAYDWTRTP